MFIQAGSPGSSFGTAKLAGTQALTALYCKRTA